jgi:hypothetical protein
MSQQQKGNEEKILESDVYNINNRRRKQYKTKTTTCELEEIIKEHNTDKENKILVIEEIKEKSDKLFSNNHNIIKKGYETNCTFNRFVVPNSTGNSKRETTTNQDITNMSIRAIKNTDSPSGQSDIQEEEIPDISTLGRIYDVYLENNRTEMQQENRKPYKIITKETT